MPQTKKRPGDLFLESFQEAGPARPGDAFLASFGDGASITQEDGMSTSKTSRAIAPTPITHGAPASMPISAIPGGPGTAPTNLELEELAAREHHERGTDPNYDPNPPLPPMGPEAIANERRTQAVGNLPLPVQRMLAESGQVNPNVGTFEDGPRPDPFGAVLGALPARGGVGRALRSGLVATAEGVIEPMANIASPLVQAVGGPDTSGPPEGMGAVFNATDPPQTPQERIGDVVGRIGSIPIQFAAMGGLNPVGAAAKLAGRSVPAIAKLPAEIAAFTGIQQAGKVAAHGQDIGEAIKATAMSTPDMIVHAGQAVPAAVQAAMGSGTGMERFAGAVESGEPALALAALAGKDKAASLIRRMVGGWNQNPGVRGNGKPADSTPQQSDPAGRSRDSLPRDGDGNRGQVGGSNTGEVSTYAAAIPRNSGIEQPVGDAVSLTPQQIQSGLAGGAIKDIPIEVRNAPPAQEAGPVAAAQEAGTVAAQSKVQAPPKQSVKDAVSGLASGMADGLYVSVFKRLEAGKRASPFDKNPSAEQRAEDAYKRGEIKTWEDVKAAMLGRTDTPGPVAPVNSLPAVVPGPVVKYNAPEVDQFADVRQKLETERQNVERRRKEYGFKRPWEMTSDELTGFEQRSREHEKTILDQVFGPQAAEYRKLERAANATTYSKEGDQKSRDAYKRMQAIEDTLSADKQDLLYGRSGAPYETPDIYRDFRREVEYANENDVPSLIRGAANAIREIGPDPDIMKNPEKATHRQQLAMARMSAINRAIETFKIDSKQISDGIKRASVNSVDPSDVDFMFEKWFAREGPKETIRPVPRKLAVDQKLLESQPHPSGASGPDAPAPPASPLSTTKGVPNANRGVPSNAGRTVEGQSNDPAKTGVPREPVPQVVDEARPVAQNAEPALVAIEPRVDTPARVQGESPAPGALAPEPKTIGLSLKENAKLRKRMGIDDLPPAQRRAREEGYKEAIDRNLHRDAHDIAQRAVSGDVDVPLKDIEAVHVGMMIEIDNLESRIETSRKTEAELRSKGDTAGADFEKQRAIGFEQQANTISIGSRMIGTRTAQALGARGSGIEKDTHAFIPVMQRATEANKGRSVPEADRAEFRRLTDTIKEQNTEIERLSKEQETRDIEVERRVAEEILKHEAKRTKPRDRTASRFTAERDSIKKQLAALGHQVNVGLDPKGAVLVGKLAASYAAEGIVSLKDNIKRVLQDLPDLTEEQVRHAINARSPKAIEAARAEASRNVASLRKQADLLTKIEKAEQGIFESTPRKAPAALPLADDIGALRKQLTELRAEAYKGITDGKRLETVVNKINQIQDDLANERHTVKKTKTAEVSQPLADARAKLADLRKEMRVGDSIADLQKQLDAGEFTVRPQAVAKPIDPVLRRKMIERDKIKREVDDRIETIRDKATYAEKSPLGKAAHIGGRVVSQTVDEMRSLKATADMSAVMRQGLVLSVTRPLEATKAFIKAAEAGLSERRAEEIDHDIRRSETFYLADAAKLELSEIDGKPSRGEENFRGRLVERIPGLGRIVKASNRHMTTYLNVMRKTAFDQFLEANPNATMPELTAWADFINKATGKGDLKAAGISGRALSKLAFAPRFAVSRFQTPTTILKHWSEPRVRKAIAKDMAGTLALGGTALTLAAMAGAKVGLDPRDSDFGKAIFGDTRVDFWGGFQQPARLLLGAGFNITDRMGLTKTPDQRIMEQYDPVESVGRFASFKLNPAITTAKELWTGRDMIGKRVNLATKSWQNPKGKPADSDIAANALLPLFVQDTWDAYKNGSGKKAAATGVLNFLGIGTSTYKKKDKAKAVKH